MPSGVGCLTVITPEAAALAAAKILGYKDKVQSLQNANRQKIIKADKELDK